MDSKGERRREREKERALSKQVTVLRAVRLLAVSAVIAVLCESWILSLCDYPQIAGALAPCAVAGNCNY